MGRRSSSTSAKCAGVHGRGCSAKFGAEYVVALRSLREIRINRTSTRLVGDAPREGIRPRKGWCRYETVSRNRVGSAHRIVDGRVSSGGSLREERYGPMNEENLISAGRDGFL